MNILLTRDIEDNMKSKLEEHGINYSVVPFIAISICRLDEKTIAHFSDKNLTSLIFTSKNAVNGFVHNNLSKIFDSASCYCVGQKTANRLTDIGFVPKIICNTAQELAEELKDRVSEKFLYLKGNISLDVIPNTLAKYGIEVDEIIIYNTTKHNTSIDTTVFDTVMFCSPSAVDAFFELNTVSLNTQIYAIGSTTAEAVKNYIQKEVLIPGTPTVQSLIDMII